MEGNKGILQSKFTDNVTNKTKTEAWKAITEKLVYGLYRLVFTSNGVVVGVVIRSVKRYDLVKIKPTESEAEH